ncbi:glycosyltransferase [Vibrio aestuarianus]|uniref:Glycosyltransferase n=1 Tax=Vibrio aestuarianus TaxID=28171 RepID=A0AAX3U254_9VIBR|nr:glycosyltransferase [Vibrio aestuarianus]WGK81281.1 glycosyltransferase [Vibrio aestuarianus]
MNETPLVTVILTSYNHGQFIAEAIDSVLNQTYGNFELIIWDDCSIDDSWKVIQSYSDERIRAFRNEQQSRGIYGINKTVREVAKGEYIAIHHSDDVWNPEKLRLQVEFFLRDSAKKYGACFTLVELIDECSATTLAEDSYYSYIFNQENKTREEWLCQFVTTGNALCHPSVLLRQEVFEKCGLYRYGIPQLGDYDLWFRLVFEFDLHIIQSPLTRFRLLNDEKNMSSESLTSLSRMPMEALNLYLSTLTKYKSSNQLKTLINELDIKNTQPQFHVALMYLNFIDMQDKPCVSGYLSYIEQNTRADFFKLRYIAELNGEIKRLIEENQVTNAELDRTNSELLKCNKKIKNREKEIVNLAKGIKHYQWGI